jgi:hypothetical protein
MDKQIETFEEWFEVNQQVLYQLEDNIEPSTPEYVLLAATDMAWQAATKQKETFQSRVGPWLLACFGEEISNDKVERNHRFLEESLELVQSTGCTKSEAYQLVDYVFNRDIGEPFQEVGGVMVTLAALCRANDLDMAENGETELARIWTLVEKIRTKQAGKPKHSPLPQHTEQSQVESLQAEIEQLKTTTSEQLNIRGLKCY